MSLLRSDPVRTLSRAALVAFALACSTGGPAYAQGATGWTQFQGDAAHSGAFEAGPDPPLHQIWRFAPPEGALSGAVIAGDLAISVGEQAVYGLALATGDEAWEVPRDGGRISMPAVGEGPEGSIVVFLEGPAGAEGGTAESASPSGETGETTADDGAASALVAVDVADQKELWRKDLEAESRCGVTVEGDLVFTADDDGTVYAFDLATGSEAWTAQVGGRVDAPPAVADGRVFVVSRDADGQNVRLTALDAATGKQAWRFASQAGAAAASAVSVADGSVVFGAADRLVRRLSAERGSLLWDSLTLTLLSPVTAPALSPGSVYVADASGGVYKLELADGGRDWEHQLNDIVVRSAPVVSGTHVLVGLNDGRLVALEPDRGDLVWESDASKGLIGAIALSPEVVVAVKGGTDAGLVAFEHDPEGSLVRVPSPTVVDPGRLFGTYALALLIASVAIYVPFRFLRSRMGAAFGEEEEAGELDDARSELPTDDPDAGQGGEG